MLIMKKLNNYICEKLHLDHNLTHTKYQPEDIHELRRIIREIFSKHGLNANLNNIDVSNITNMQSLFMSFPECNPDISKWDVSNVTNMKEMFYGCYKFNCDISNWDVSNCQNFYQMFTYCKSFSQNIDNWDVKKDANKDNMFLYCKNMIGSKRPKWFIK